MISLAPCVNPTLIRQSKIMRKPTRYLSDAFVEQFGDQGGLAYELSGLIINAKLSVLIASHGVHACILAIEYGVIFSARNQLDDNSERADLGLNKKLSFTEHPAQT